jgi:3-deoxy-D-manno-octulosonate 8-phosphate phosphatase (KDO 8-P phosphatase)
MGDDIVDIPVLTICGFPVTVADADDDVKKSAVLVTRARGGRGAVREVCDLFLKAKGLWQDILDEYTQA